MRNESYPPEVQRVRDIRSFTFERAALTSADRFGLIKALPAQIAKVQRHACQITAQTAHVTQCTKCPNSKGLRPLPPTPRKNFERSMVGICVHDDWYTKFAFLKDRIRKYQFRIPKNVFENLDLEYQNNNFRTPKIEFWGST